MRWWERAVIAAVSIVVGWAFLVIFLVGLRAYELHLQAKARRRGNGA